MLSPARLLAATTVATAFLSSLHAQCVAPQASTFSTLYQGTTYLGSPDPVYGANMLFDLDCSVDITISQIAVNLYDGPGAAANPNLLGETSDVVVWTCATTWIGNEAVGTGGTNPATPPGWTQVGAGVMTVAAPNQPSVIVLNAPISITAGTYGMAIQHLPTIPSAAFPSPQVIHPLYTNPASAVGTPTVWTDQFLTLTAGAGQGSAFQSGVAQPRVINCDIDYSVGPNTAYATLYGGGCYDRPQAFYENFAAPGNVDLTSLDLTYLGPNYVASATANGLLPFNQPGAIHVNAAPPGATGTAASNQWDDANSIPIALPASWGSWPYPTGSTTQIEVNSNGVIWLQTSTRTAAFYNAVTAMLTEPASIIGCYGDWEPVDVATPTTGAGNIYVDVGPGDTYVAVTWDQVAEWNQPATTNTFQIVLTPGGGVSVNYGAVGMVAAPAMVGFSPGSQISADPGSIDLSVVASPAYITGDGSVAPTLDLDARPVAGTTPNFVTDNINTQTAANATLLSFSSLPGIDLTAIGVAAPGCSAYIGVAGSASIGLQIGNASPHSVAFPIPGGPTFVGLQLYSQSAQLVPGINTAGVSVSNAICLTIGSQ